MKRYLNLVAVCILCSLNLSAKNVDLKNIVQDKYTESVVPEMKSVNDDEYYTQLSEDKKRIVKGSYKTGKIVDTLFNVATAKECTFKTIDGYVLSDDEKKILLYTDKEPVYRRSFKANYYTFEIRRNLVKPLSDGGKQQAALFSPNGRVVAFVRDNNIYLKKLDFNTESAVTKDGACDSIINGIPDWVYEEEFACTNSMAWSSDSEYLSFIKYNETDVKQYTIPFYEGMCPAYEQYSQYPGFFRYKYPVAGTKNSTVGVYTFVLDTKVTKKMDITVEDGYIPRIRYATDPTKLIVMTLNRYQNQFRMYTVNCLSGVNKLLLQDENETWIDPKNMDFITIYPNFFVFASEKSGYRQLYQYSMTGTLMKQITQGDYDVTDFLGYDQATGSFFYQTASPTPMNRSVYKVDAKGKSICLTPRKGTNDVSFSSMFKYYVLSYSNANTPTVVSVNNQKGDKIRTIENNKNLVAELEAITFSKKEFFSFKNSEGISLNGWVMKPADFSDSKKYPLVMVQYSGPGSQEVLDKWNFDWEQYLTAQGYVVACVDGRGTGGRGTAFSRSVFLQLGYLEALDQIDAAKYLGTLKYVDSNNISVWGWSFGGYTSLMCLTMSDVFKAGVAIAPVTDWKYYNTIYTERYMHTPKENFEGYAKTSPLLHADKLSGNLLIVSGTADDNVHMQNTLEFSEALVQANKQFDMQLYTNRNHSIRGCNTRFHLYTKVCNFIQAQ